MRSFFQSIYQAASPRLILNQKRVTAPQTSEQSNDPTQSPISSSSSLPEAPVDHVARLRSLMSEFNTPLEDAIKMKDPQALDHFDSLLTQCTELYNSPTLPDHLSIPASQLLKRMNMLKMAVAGSKTPLRTSVQLQNEMQQASMKLELQREADIQSMIRSRQHNMQTNKNNKVSKKSKKQQLTASGRKRRRQSDDSDEDSSDSEADSFDELDLVDSSESDSEVKPTPRRTVKSSPQPVVETETAVKSPEKSAKPQVVAPSTPRAAVTRPTLSVISGTPTSIRTTRSTRITPSSSVISATPVTRRSVKRLTLPASPETIKSNLSKLRNRVHVDEAKLQSANKNKRVKRSINQSTSSTVFDFDGDL